MKKRLFTVSVGDPDSLADFLVARGISTELISRGNVRVDGQRIINDAEKLSTGAGITVFVEIASSSPTIPVIFRDDALLVVDKPAGLASLATPTTAEALDAIVGRTISESAHPIHRLDRDASGLVIFAASPYTIAPLQASLETGEIERSYVARVAGELDGSGTIRLRIARDPVDSRKRQALPENAPAGLHAVSHFRVIAHEAGITVVALTLETGRTHQLRVHLAALGHPIVGDRLYGGPTAGRLHLHATSLTLPHPNDRRPLQFESPAPFLTSSLH